jgi:hypothetical protein
MSNSSDVVAGTNATSTHYNNLRVDAINEPMVFYFEVKGLLSVDNAQASITVPYGMTVTKIKYKVVSGTATFKFRKDADTVQDNLDATSSYQDQNTITSGVLTAGQELILDITASASGTTARILVYATYTK